LVYFFAAYYFPCPKNEPPNADGVSVGEDSFLSTFPKSPPVVSNGLASVFGAPKNPPALPNNDGTVSLVVSSFGFNVGTTPPNRPFCGNFCY
jgi:hypothetical protein